MAKTCLAVLIGVVIGVVGTTQIRTVQAQGATVFVDSSQARGDQKAAIKIRGSKVVGFSCTVVAIGAAPYICFVASQMGFP